MVLQTLGDSRAVMRRFLLGYGNARGERPRSRPLRWNGPTPATPASPAEERDGDGLGWTGEGGRLALECFGFVLAMAGWLYCVIPRR
jgi:hypothetical protein